MTDSRLDRVIRPPPGQALGAAIPIGKEGWQDFRVGTWRGLVRYDEAPRTAGEGRFQAFASPRIATDANGAPAVNLTLLLAEQPPAEAESLVPFVDSGRLAVELVTRTSALELERLERALGGVVQPLQSRRVLFSILHGEQLLADGQGRGVAARTGISAQLDGEQCRSVLRALNSEAAETEFHGPYIRAVAEYEQLQRVSVRLRGDWQAIHDALADRAGASGFLSQMDVEGVVGRMLTEGILLLSGVDDPAQRRSTGISMFLRVASVLLERRSTGVYRLRSRPAPVGVLELTDTRESRAARSIETTAQLDELLASSFAAHPAAPHVHPVALSPSRLSAVVVPVKSRSTRLGPEMQRGTQLALVNANVLHSATLVRPTVHASLVSTSHNAAAVLPGGGVTTKPRPRSLPVVSDAAAADPPAVFTDRINPNRRWYLPRFELAQVDPGAAWDQTAFAFEFERTGVTASGRPAIAGTIRFRLVSRPHPDAQAVIERERNAGRVVGEIRLDEVRVTLQVPFVAENSGQTGHRAFVCRVTSEESGIECTVQLANDWVRLAYGALSTPGFQPEMPVIHVAGEYTCYAPIGVSLQAGGKAARLGDLEAGAVDARLISGGVAVDLLRSRVSTAMRVDGRNLPLKARPMKALTLQPSLALSSGALTHLVNTKYVLRKRRHDSASEMSVPCLTHPTSYRERVDGQLNVVGCQDALLLGQADPRLVGELTHLATERLRVFRSLQQPDLFLMLPVSYRITRRRDGEQAVPAIALHSVLDAERADQTRFVYQVTLQPDITPLERRQVLSQLLELTAEPIVRFPTEFDLNNLEVTLGSTGEATHAADGPFLVHTINCELADALIVKSQLETGALAGHVRFGLGDGSTLTSSLSMSLREIDGPWDVGPIEVTPLAGEVQLSNPTESAYEIFELHTFDPPATIPLQLQLQAGEARRVTVGEDCREVYVVASRIDDGPTSLEEVRSFVEEVSQFVVFFADFDFSGHQLAAVEIEAEIEGAGQLQRVRLDAEKRAEEVMFSLPLTHYIADPILRYRAIKLATDGTRDDPAFSETRLEEGALIAVSWTDES